MSYQTDASGNETVDPAATEYAKDKNGHYFYPKNKDNDEFRVEKLGYIQENGAYRLPINRNGLPIYPTEKVADNSGTLKDKQIYPKINDKYIIGRGLNGDQYYAKDENGNEYYPQDGTFAYYNNNTPRYIVRANATIFPLDSNGDEKYITEVIPSNMKTVPSRYAKQNNDKEIYPKTKTADNYLTDYILGDRYAKDNAQREYYPKDAFGNEFYLPEKNAQNASRTAADLVKVRYAQTNDAKIILPSIQDTAVVIGTITTATVNDTIGRLIREGTKPSDFLTNKDGDNILRSDTPINYLYIDTSKNIIHRTNFTNAKTPQLAEECVYNVLASSITITPTASTAAKPFFKTWSFWIVVVFSLIMKSIAIWWFFFKNKVNYTK